MKKMDYFYQKYIDFKFLIWFLYKRLFLNCFYVICPCGIGDTLMAAMLVKQLKLVVDPNIKVCLIVKKNHIDILNMFKDVDYRLISKDIPSNLDMYGSLGLFVAHPSFVKELNLESLIGYKNITLFDIYKILFNIPLKNGFERPVVLDSKKISAKHKFDLYGLLKKKTVVLAPEATSCGMISMEFWEKLTIELTKLGLIVCSIYRNKDNYIKGTISVDFTLGEAISFVEESGCFISVRSGLCDLVAFSDADIHVVYPAERWHGGMLIDGCSLVGMGFNKFVNEYEYTGKNDNLVREIVLKLSKFGNLG